MIEVTRKINDWEWDAKCMNDDELKDDCRNDPIASLERLYKCGRKIVLLMDSVEDGSYSMLSLICDVKDMWDAVNFARLWPEAQHAPIDELLETALSHLAEVHFMVEGAFELKGYIPNGTARLVRNEMLFALELIKGSIEEIEQYVHDTLDDNEGE